MKLMKIFWRRKNDLSFSPQLENRKIKFSSNLSTRLSQTYVGLRQMHKRYLVSTLAQAKSGMFWIAGYQVEHVLPLEWSKIVKI